MTTFADFPSTTHNLGLPYLFSGQSQKEFFLNHSLVVIDGLLRHGIVAALASPPTASVDGDCYIIASPALDGWAGRENYIAVRVGGDWHYIAPVEGVMMFDRQLGQYRHFNNGWLTVEIPGSTTGGAVIDVEARALLADVIDALVKLRLVAPILV